MPLCWHYYLSVVFIKILEGKKEMLMSTKTENGCVCLKLCRLDTVPMCQVQIKKKKSFDRETMSPVQYILETYIKTPRHVLYCITVYSINSCKDC
jgi:hypothetical protein